jgi:hypothetical protein
MGTHLPTSRPSGALVGGIVLLPGVFQTVAVAVHLQNVNVVHQTAQQRARAGRNKDYKDRDSEAIEGSSDCRRLFQT